jgi:hypothetical protein
MAWFLLFRDGTRRRNERSACPHRIRRKIETRRRAKFDIHPPFIDTPRAGAFGISSQAA